VPVCAYGICFFLCRHFVLFVPVCAYGIGGVCGFGVYVGKDEIELNGFPKGARSLRKYGWQDHARVAARATLESLAVFPFWACKVSAITGCARLPSLNPYPWGWPTNRPTQGVGGGGGCFKALRTLVEAEGVASGLFKGALPMVVIGVSQALVLAVQRHIRFVRLVEESRNLHGGLAHPAVPRSPPTTTAPATAPGTAPSTGRGDLPESSQGDGPPWSNAAKENDPQRSNGLAANESLFNSGASAGSFASGLDSESDLGSGWGSGSGSSRARGTRRIGGGKRGSRRERGRYGDPWPYVYQLMRVVVRHPFELLGVRLVTSSSSASSKSPYARSALRALWHHLVTNDLASLFAGIRQSLFNAVCLPRPSLRVATLGIPTLIHARRMLDPSAGGGLGRGASSNVHSGLGGSVELLTNMVREEGPASLLTGRAQNRCQPPSARASIIAFGFLLESMRSPIHPFVYVFSFFLEAVKEIGQNGKECGGGLG